MFFLKSVYCRIFQGAFRLALPFLPYREPQIIRSCGELDAIFQKETVTSILVVTDNDKVVIGGEIKFQNFPICSHGGWTRKPGWIYPCGINPTATFTKNCFICF